MAIQTVDDILEHHGIKGQKWGVRRSEEELARLRDPADRREYIKKSQNREFQAKHLTELTDDDVQKLKNRIDNERSIKSYVKDLSPKSNKRAADIIRGISFSTKNLSEAFTAFAKTPLGYYLFEDFNKNASGGGKKK